MATVVSRSIASVHRIAELGELDPEAIVAPGIFVSRIVKVDPPGGWAALEAS